MGIFQIIMLRNYSLFLVLVLIACESKKTETSVGGVSVMEKQEPTLNTAVTSEEYEKLEADLFGEFHNSRVSTFISENLNVAIYGVLPKKVVLYYIDEELLQKKYKLPPDITHDLISVNEKLKIRGLNSRNDYFIKRLKPRILYGSEIVSLTNHYQLRRENEGDKIIYQVRRNTIKTSYTYIEQAKGCKQILKRVQSAVSV